MILHILLTTLNIVNLYAANGGCDIFNPGALKTAFSIAVDPKKLPDMAEQHGLSLQEARAFLGTTIRSINASIQHTRYVGIAQTDRVQKRIRFLNELVDAIGLKNGHASETTELRTVISSTDFEKDPLALYSIIKQICELWNKHKADGVEDIKTEELHLLGPIKTALLVLQKAKTTAKKANAVPEKMDAPDIDEASALADRREKGREKDAKLRTKTEEGRIEKKTQAKDAIKKMDIPHKKSPFTPTEIVKVFSQTYPTEMNLISEGVAKPRAERFFVNLMEYVFQRRNGDIRPGTVIIEQVRALLLFSFESSDPQTYARLYVIASRWNDFYRTAEPKNIKRIIDCDRLDTKEGIEAAFKIWFGK